MCFYCSSSVACAPSWLCESCPGVHLLGCLGSNPDTAVPFCLVSHQKTPQGMINTSLISVF